MTTYRAKLTPDAFDKAQEHDTGVSIFESQERYDQRVDDDGFVELRKREFDRLRLLGLIEDSEVTTPAEAQNPDLDDDNQRTRTLIPRLPQKATAVHPGGVGHQPNDAYSNEQVNKEFQRDQAAGAARGRAPEQDSVLEASRRADGHLPEQVKAYEKSVEDHEKSVEKARSDATKERERQAKEQERQAEKDQKAAEKERRDRAGETKEAVTTPSDTDTSKNQGAGQAEDQNRAGQEAGDVPRGDGESDAAGKARGGAAAKSKRS